MIKKNILLALFAGSLLHTSCDNYLDIVPKGEAVLNTTEDYLGLIEEHSPIYEVSNSWFMADEATWYKRYELDSYKDPLRAIAFFWDEQADRIQYSIEDGLYNQCYKRISNYNIVVENIYSAEGSEEDKALGMAQAKIMRAYNYFFLVNSYAKFYNPATAATDRGVIVHKQFDLEAKSRQYSVQEVYDFIEQDIADALSDLPKKPLNEFRPGRSFGYALKAKVHLYKAELDLALAAALEATKSDYHRLWDMNEMYESTMAQNPILAFMPTMWGQLATHPYSDPENLLYQFGGTYSDPFPMYIRKHIVDLYEKGADIRLITCFGAMPPRPTTEDGVLPYSANKVGWNVAGIRLSEVYLMIAECYARTGKTDEAMKYVNLLREKRILKKAYKALEAKDADEALKMVREERKRELVLTANGFFDMRRFCAQFNETLTKEYTNANKETKSYTLTPDSHLLIYPFPQNAIETSDLYQNSK